jgi:YVTN family beta-propeller protein
VNTTLPAEAGVLTFPGASTISSLAYDPIKKILYAAEPSQAVVAEENVSGSGTSLSSISLTGAQDVFYDAVNNTLLVTTGSSDTLAVVNTSSHTVGATYAVGLDPTAVAAIPGTEEVYVANTGGSNVTVLNLSTSATKSLPVGSGPSGVAFDAANGLVYVSNEWSGNVSILNPATTNVTGSISLGGATSLSGLGVVYDPVDRELYVPSAGGNSPQPNVTVLGGTSNSTVATIQLPYSYGFPSRSALDPGTGAVWVSQWTNYGVAEISTNDTLRGVMLGMQPDFVAAVDGPGTVVVGDSNQGVGAFDAVSGGVAPEYGSAGVETTASIYAPQADRLYLVTYDGALFALNTSNLSQAFPSAGTGYPGTGVAYDPTTNRVFGLSMNSMNVTVFNATSLVRTNILNIPGDWRTVQPWSMTVDPDRQELFVGEAGQVAVYNSSTLASVGTISLSEFTGTLTYDWGDGQVYASVNSGNGGLLYRLDAANLSATLVTNLGGSGGAFWLAYSPITGDLYDATLGNRTVLIVNPDTGRIVQNISIAGAAWSTTVDLQSGDVFAAAPSTGGIADIETVNGTPPFVAGFSASADPTPVNQFLELVANVTGGTAPYELDYTGLPPGCVSANVSALACVPTRGGNFTVHLQVVDAAGVSTNATLSFEVVAPPAPSLRLQSFTGAPSTVDNGSTVDLSVVTVTNASWLSYAYSGLPPGCMSANSSDVPCRSTEAGTFDVSVTVRGPDGLDKTANATIHVLVDPAFARFSMLPDPVSVGSTLTVVATVTGGESPYTLQFSDLPTGCSSASSVSFHCVPTAAGTFSASVSATDALGFAFSAQASVTVQPLVPTPAVDQFVVSPATVTVGNSTEFYANATGHGASLTYVYTGLPGGCRSANTTRLACVPLSPGSFTVTVNVSATGGSSVTAVTKLTVRPAPTGPQPVQGGNNSTVTPGGSVGFSGGVGTELLGIGLAVVAVALVAGVLLTRRRRTPPSDGNDPAEPEPVETPADVGEPEGPPDA